MRGHTVSSIWSGGTLPTDTSRSMATAPLLPGADGKHRCTCHRWIRHGGLPRAEFGLTCYCERQ